MSPSRADAQVVIVGAGPVGLLLACELRRARVQAVVVERLAGPMTESRASQLTTLTAELLHERGFDALLAEAAHEPRTHFGGLGFALSAVDSAYAGNWKVPQYRTEAALGERAVRLGATVLRAHELTGLTQRPDHVLCRIQGPDGPARIRAQYVVGCDGAHSTVRRLAGFPVTAKAATKELLRADLTGLRIRDRRFERLAGGFAVAATRDGVTRVMVHAFGAGVAERTAPPAFGEVVQAWERVTGEDVSGAAPSGWTPSTTPRDRPTPTGSAGSCWPATPPTGIRRSAARRSTPGSRTRSTWAAPSPRPCTAAPRPDPSTPTTTDGIPSRPGCSTTSRPRNSSCSAAPRPSRCARSSPS